MVAVSDLEPSYWPIKFKHFMIACSKSGYIYWNFSQAPWLLVMCTPVSLSTHHTSISNHPDSDIRSCLRCSPEAIQVTHQTINTVSKHIVVLGSRSETGMRMGCVGKRNGNGMAMEWKLSSEPPSVWKWGIREYTFLTHLTWLGAACLGLYNQSQWLGCHTYHWHCMCWRWRA